MNQKKFKKNEIIIQEGDTIDSSSFLYFLMAGTVAVSTQKDGKQFLIKNLEAGTYFGELALITRAPRKATISVESDDVVCGVLDVNAFERLMGPCRELMERNIDVYAEELAKLSIS